MANMKSSMIFMFIVSVICSVGDSLGADPKLLNWKTDDNSLPEMLPKNLLGKSNEEIQKAVFNSYTNQMKMVSEYSGHVYDPEFPFGYFKNEFPVPETQSYQPEDDLIFVNNVVKGLNEYTQNEIVFKWTPDVVETEVQWKNAKIVGNYVYTNSTYYEDGNYEIKFENLKYQANTTFSENTMNYPAMVPKTSISYKNMNAVFSENRLEVNDIKNLPNVKYFVEDIAFQHIANEVARSLYKNITIGVRQAIKPYIMFKNYSDPHFKSFTGVLPTGLNYTAQNLFTSGLNRTNLRVKDVFVDMANKNVTALYEFVVYNILGDMNVQVANSTPYTAKAQFTIDRIHLITAGNMINGTECWTVPTFFNTKVKTTSVKLGSEVDKIIVDDFVKSLIKKFTSAICVALNGMLNPDAGNVVVPETIRAKNNY